MILALTFTDGLAVSAIVLAVVTIGFEVAFFTIQTQQLYKGQKESADYLAQMREVLGKIEGMTTSTREQLEKQFSTVLEASLGKQGSVVSEAMTQEIAQQVKGVEERLTQVEGNTTGQADLAVQVRGELNRLRGDLSRAAEEMPKKTRDRPEEVFALFWEAGMEGLPVVGSTLVAFAKNVTDHARQVTIHFRTPDHPVMGSSRIVDPGDRHEVEAILQTPGPAEVEIIDNGTSKRWVRRFTVYST